MGTVSRASRRFLILGTGGAMLSASGLSFAAAAGSFQTKARDTLFRCIERGSLVTMTAIVVQKGNTPNCPPNMQLKIAQDSKGNKAVTVLQPMSMLGIKSSMFNGKMSQYYPDENRVVIQPAPKPEREDIKLRMGLADRNYSFTLERNGNIAGQDTVVVTATPRFPEMPLRRYSIDIDKDVLLRLETVDENGRKSTVFDTQAIWYPKSLPDETFELKTVGRVRVINVPGPIRIESPAMAKAMTGITHIVPKDLPFGFVVRDPQIVGDEGKRFIAVRITDGLLMATVYQWDRKLGDLLGKDEGGLDRVVGGLRIRLVGELPPVVHFRLLDLFAKEAAKVFRPDGEPDGIWQVLGKAGKPPAAASPNPKDGVGSPPAETNPVDDGLMQTLASFLTVLQSGVSDQ